MIPIPACVLVISPVAGRLRRTVADGVEVARGDVVATVEQAGVEVDVRSPLSGRVGGLLVDLLTSVTTGDGVLWLQRA